MAGKQANDATNKQRAYWQQEIEKAKKRFKTFWDNGDNVVDAYRLQKSDGNDAFNKDKYNILYSSTETIRPNLYAQRPNVRVKVRNKDTATPVAVMAAQLLESSLSYIIEEEDFDELMENAVEDYLLPGLGSGWVRYEPRFTSKTDEDNKPVLGDDGKPRLELLDEMVKMDYIYWQDFLVGVSRGWRTVPWVGRRLWLTKEDATKRFGEAKAGMLTYCQRESSGRDADTTSETAEAWEIWDKRTKQVYWYAESYSQDLLDVKDDPLKLKAFFPCPRPLRAISNTRTFVPRALYSQYKSQAETLNVMTKRIRLLGEAIRVSGVYDGSQLKLADLLNPASGNRMIAVDTWAMFAQAGGIKGVVDWLPIDQVAAALVQLQQARETAKIEIYEITGFSDIVRGVSKASETLGAQNLKANWAGARVRKMQKEVQRFARDMIALAGELVAEHCEPATIGLFAGVTPPTPEEVQANPEALQGVQTFMAAVQSLKDEARRLATVDIETDSTIMADEEAERKDRMDFLAAAGAFLQQAVPAMETTPEMGPLLGAMLMFTVRTFPSSRPIEEAFEQVQKMLAAKPPKPADADPNGHAAKAQAAQQVAQVRAGVDTQKAQLDAQGAAQELQVKAQEGQARLAQEAQAETNRHNEKMAELGLKERELALREREVSVKEAELSIQREEVQIHAATAAADSARADDQQDHQQNMDHAGIEQQYDKMDREDANAERKDALTAKKPDV